MKIKKFVILLLSLSFVAGMTACGSRGNQTVTGGWSEPEDASVTDEIRGYVEKATADISDVSYEPVKVLGKQVVAGWNYRILCNVTPAVPGTGTTQKTLKIYVDLDGNCKLMSETDYVE